VKLSVGSRTDVGRVRQGNEDSYLVAEPLFVIADGMGGHLAGDVASATAVEVITAEASDLSVADPSTLEKVVRDANEAIWAKAQGDPTLNGMGTTCTLLLIDGDRGRIAHVGDSRAYLLRDGELSQLTEDHTLVQKMVNEGRLEPDEAEVHPQRSIVTRGLGIYQELQVDMLPLTLRPGDRLMLCSDGLNSMIRPDAMREALAGAPDAQSAADKLVDLANAAGGEDNVTVIVIDVLDDDDASPAPPHEQTRARMDTDDEPSHPVSASSDVGPSPSRSWVRRVVVAVVVLVLLVAGGFGATRYTLDHSWFVGADDQGIVTIYRGIPENVLGMDLKDSYKASGLSVDDLPASLAQNVQEGIKRDSIEEARATVADLQQRADEFAPSPPKRKHR
jgi:protein phosphatase